jgi:sensor histidine kinase YesM
MRLYHLFAQNINRISQHILFWFLSLLIFAYIFKISDSVGKIDILFSVLFHISILPGVYLNLLLLVPYLFKGEKYLFYIFAVLMLIVGITFFNQLTFDRITDIILPGYYFVSQFNYLETSILVVIYIVGTTVLSLSKSWFKMQEVKARITKIEKENIDSQLKSLKAQINPHFLFNSLNVLYSLTLKHSDETADAIIKLSDILRYIIYDSEKEKVSIKSEVALINNYLSLQKHRIESSSNVQFETIIKNEIQISPMLLLPLVENSFKHGVKGDILNTYVRIRLIASNETMHFEIENNKGISDDSAEITEGGVGLSNIQKRLNLLYPDKHHFLINQDERIFKVTLKIEL